MCDQRGVKPRRHMGCLISMYAEPHDFKARQLPPSRRQTLTWGMQRYKNAGFMVCPEVQGTG